MADRLDLDAMRQQMEAGVRPSYREIAVLCDEVERMRRVADAARAWAAAENPPEHWQRYLDARLRDLIAALDAD